MGGDIAWTREILSSSSGTIICASLVYFGIVLMVVTFTFTFISHRRKARETQSFLLTGCAGLISLSFYVSDLYNAGGLAWFYRTWLYGLLVSILVIPIFLWLGPKFKKSLERGA